MSDLQVLKLVISINIKKAVDFDFISPKLVKVSTDLLSKPSTIANNASLRRGICPDEAKIALVVAIDKRKPNNNEIFNYTPVSLFNIFPKINENMIKNHLLPGFKHCFSPFICIYRKGYSTQQVILRLVDE